MNEGKSYFPVVLRQYLKLHFIIVLWGFTAVLGALITLPATEMVVWRTALAALTIALVFRQRLKVEQQLGMRFFLTGLVIGFHWVTFFTAVKIANVSICMVGLATLSLWTALLEPVFRREKRIRLIDLVFGAVIVLGAVMIFRSEMRYSSGFLVALLSAVAAAIFSILNSFHVGRAHHLVITFYEMAGACVFAALALPLMMGPDGVQIWPTMMDAVWLVILAVLCTVVSFGYYIELLKYFSVFAINFANNLEPLYGIVLAAMILKDHQYLGPGFYAGAAVIGTAVLFYPLVTRNGSPRR